MKQIYILILLFLFGLSFVSATSIGDVSFSFCNSGSDTSNINFVAKAGETYPICLSFSNLSDEPSSISYGFVDGVMTNDELSKKACSFDSSKFGSYITFDESSLLLSAGSFVQKTGYINFPLGYSGEVHGCVVYSIAKIPSSLKKNDSMFDVVVRRASFLDGLVVGEYTRSLDPLFDKIDYYVDQINNSLVVSIPFFNSGVISELLVYTGTVKNFLGYERSITTSQILDYLTGSVVVFDFGDIPFYKGKYYFTFEGTSRLDTTLDISYIPDSVKKPLEFSFVKNIYLIPWKIIFGIIGFFIMLFLLRAFMKIILRR